MANKQGGRRSHSSRNHKAMHSGETHRQRKPRRGQDSLPASMAAAEIAVTHALLALSAPDQIKTGGDWPAARNVFTSGGEATS